MCKRNLQSSRWLAARALGVVLLGAAASAAFGSPSAPSTAGARSSAVEAEPLRVNGAAPREAPIPARAPATQVSSSVTVASPRTSAPLRVDWTRMALSLGVVIGLIVLLRWVLRRMSGTATGAGGRAVRVLSRTPLGPRQQVLLLQVGRRVIVAGESAGQLSALAQITEPDEVASLLGELSPHDAGAARPFGRLLGQAEEEFDPRESSMPIAEKVAPPRDGAKDYRVDSARSELAGLMNKVHGLARQFNTR